MNFLRPSGTRYLIIAVAMSVWASCSQRDAGPVEPPGPPVFSRDVQPLLAGSCATSGCHSSAARAADFAVETWEDIFEGSNHGAMVIPFRPDKSHLIFHVNTDTNVAPVAEPLMPPGGPLSPQHISMLMEWIRDGARNDAGDVAFSTSPQGRVLVTNQADDEIAVIDIATNLVARMVPVGTIPNRSSPPEAPHNVVVDSAALHYYVNLITAGEVWKIRLADHALVGTLSLGAGTSPAQVALARDGSVAYVSNFSPQRNAVQLFNPQSMTLITAIEHPQMRASHGVQLTRDGRYLWTANQGSDNLHVIDLATGSVVAVVKADTSVPDLPGSVPVFEPYQLVFTPDDMYAYVTCRKSGEVRVFHTISRQLVAVIPVGSTPLIPDITPDGGYVYVPNRGSNSVTVIRTSDNSVVTTITNVGTEPHGAAVTADGAFVYVSCENVNNPDAPHHPVEGLNTPGVIAVIDAATNQVVRRIEVGAFAAGIAVAP